MKRIILIAFIFFFINVIYSNGQSIDIPFLEKTPVIDGNISKGEWDKAQHSKLNKIHNINTKEKNLQNNTDFYIGYNKEYLFTSFICYEKDMSNIKAFIHALEARDTNIWTDDCVEVLLDPLASETERYHFIINSNGIIYDAFNGNPSWDSNIRVAAKKYDDKWIVELAIPFSDFNYTPIGDEQWRGNFTRQQKLNEENSSLFPTQLISDISSFGPLVFKKPASSINDNIQLSIDQMWNMNDPNIKLSINNMGEINQKIKVAVSNTVNGQLFFETSENIDVVPQKTTRITIPYKTSPDEQNVILVVSNLSNNSIIYNNKFHLRAIEEEDGLSKKVWNIQDPLYSELFSNEPLPLGREGALCWMPIVDFKKMTTIAKQFGSEYRYENTYKLFGKNKLRAFATPNALENPSYRRVELSEKYNMKNIVFADDRDYSRDKIPFGANNKRPWPVDPIAVSAANQRIKEVLENNREVVWGVCLGDEVEKSIFRTGIEFFQKYSETDYPFIHQANQEIKEKYGYGKYGIPLDEHDQNPFRWIAFRRWANQELVKLHAELYKTVKDVAPEVHVVGNDPIAFHNPFNYRDMQCDIMTHQLYPRKNANRARFGFLTKLNVDLSGNKEFWPCAHIENYADNFEHTEVLELMSQVIRNGGTGFHFWPTDIKNIRSGSNSLYFDGNAAPYRWELQMAIVKELEKMKTLEFPNSDFAILFSTDTHASLPYGTETFEVESAYTFLGPVARSYFTFVDDYFVEKTPEQLSKYKVLYVPSAKYMRKEVANNILEYVKNGGILISGDPEIFSFSSDGTSLKHLTEELFGITVKARENQPQIKYNELILPTHSKAYEVKLQDKRNVKVVANYKDETPAIIEHQYGKGKAVFFAANPFTLKSLNDEEWKSFFTFFQKKYGLKTDHDIWRFQFPKTLIPELTPAPKGRCLTNNNLVWRRNKALVLYNEDTRGNYSYSLLPDKIREQSGVQDNYTFDKGNLTDRKEAPGAGNVDLGKGSIVDWIVSWEKPEAFDITFDFIKPRNLGKLSLFYSGELPAISLYASNDGKKWKDLKTTTEKQPFTEDVLEHILSGDFGSYQYLQVRFGKRDDERFTLVEVDVWSAE